MILALQSVYEAAGGGEGLLHLAQAWHARVMADEIVSHAFSHGPHPAHSETARRLLGRGTRRTTHLLRVLRRRNDGHTPSQRQRPTRGDGRACDRLLRPSPRRRRPHRRPAAAGATRLLRLGHHHNHVPNPSTSSASTSPPAEGLTGHSTWNRPPQVGAHLWQPSHAAHTPGEPARSTGRAHSRVPPRHRM